MITKETLINMNKEGIETLLNSSLKDFNKTSIEQSEVKQGMFEHLKKQISGMEMKYRDYHYNAFEINIDFITIVVKSGVKSTDKIIKVTKLRNKAVKGKGKFKIDFISHGVKHYCYEFINEKSWKIGIVEGCSSSGDPSSVTLTDFEFPLKDMLKVEFLVGTINEHETNNEYRQREWKGFKEELEVSVAQPVIKKIFFNAKLGAESSKKSDLKYFPEPYYSKLPDVTSNEDLFTLIVKTVAEINSELIEDVINNKTFIYND